jgi:hypothetical protein
VTGQPRLFAVAEPLPAPEPLSDTARRTRRNAELIARGVHPATHRRIRPGGLTCRDCAHSSLTSPLAYGTPRRFWKCAVHRLGQSHSAASDIRVSWPACELFTTNPSEEATSG